MDDGHIVVDSIEPIAVADITYDLARESGFASVDELMDIARHGSGENVYLIRFHYLPPGAWDTPRWKHGHGPGRENGADLMNNQQALRAQGYFCR